MLFSMLCNEGFWHLRHADVTTKENGEEVVAEDARQCLHKTTKLKQNLTDSIHEQHDMSKPFTLLLDASGDAFGTTLFATRSLRTPPTADVQQPEAEACGAQQPYEWNQTTYTLVAAVKALPFWQQGVRGHLPL